MDGFRAEGCKLSHGLAHRAYGDQSISSIYTYHSLSEVVMMCMKQCKPLREFLKCRGLNKQNKLLVEVIL